MANSWDSIVGTEEYLRVLKRAEKYAGDSGYSLNEDPERIKKVIGLMTMNVAEAGNFYCPCKQNHPINPEVDVLCPCPEIAEEIGKDGSCFCKLFFKQ